MKLRGLILIQFCACDDASKEFPETQLFLASILFMLSLQDVVSNRFTRAVTKHQGYISVRLCVTLLTWNAIIGRKYLDSFFENLEMTKFRQNMQWSGSKVLIFHCHHLIEFSRVSDIQPRNRLGCLNTSVVHGSKTQNVKVQAVPSCLVCAFHLF